MHTSGEGRYKVWLEKKQLHNDILLILGGGEQPHIGAIIVSQPEKKPQIIKIASHYDYEVLTPLAEAAQKKYNTTVVAVGGIHIDNASKEEIQIIIENCRRLISCI